MTRVSIPLAERVIEADQQELRFERFANGVVEKLEGGAPVLPTSRMRDLGRDGKGYSGGRRLFVCSTTTGLDGLRSKAEKDLAKPGLRTSERPKIYFCVNSRVTEAAMESLRPLMAKAAPAGAEIEFLSLVQIGNCVERWPEVFETHYGADYRELVSVFQAANEAAERPEAVSGLLLALQTLGHSDSESIRDEIYRAAFTAVIARAPNGLTEPEVAARLASELHLARAIAEPILREHLSRLESEGFVDRSSGRLKITAAGAEWLEKSQMEAATGLIRGKHDLRAAVEERLGYALSQDHFDRIWKEICPRFARGFLLRGQEIVSFASASIRGEDLGSYSKERGAISKLLEDLSEGVRAATDAPHVADEICTALGDVFEERDSPAHRWLLGICAAYVCVCALGLEDSVGREAAQVVRSTELVFDTDIVLSLLGESEPAHAAVKEVATRWRKLGGQTFATTEVVQEAAHHAWIAGIDFSEVEHWLPGTALERDRYVDNVFVRSFGQLLEERRARKNQWETYIGQFRGESKGDLTKLWACLGVEGVAGLPIEEGEDPELHEEVSRVVEEVFLPRIEGARLRQSELDKAEKDCSLYEKVVRRRRRHAREGLGHGCVLLTSSRRLLKLEAHMRGSSVGHVAISLAEGLFLLSMLPGTSLGLSALEAFLFETYPHRFGSPVERTVLRVIHDAADFEIGWAKRHALMDKLRSKVFENAKARGTSRRKELSVEFLSAENAESSANTILYALREVAATDRREEEIKRLSDEVRKLEQELRKHWRPEI